MKKLSLLSLFAIALVIAACGPKADPEVVSQADQFQLKWDSLKVKVVELQKDAQSNYETVNAEITKFQEADILGKVPAGVRPTVESAMNNLQNAKNELDLAQANLQAIADAFISRSLEFEELRKGVMEGTIKKVDYDAAIAPFQEFWEQNAGRCFYWEPNINNAKMNAEANLNILNSY